ncbi:MAG: hypothetical protein IPK60_01255 [Sandaracinaceae bacterium]|nr:hypothetical protein [Sandaracinaceae bacterium]
MRSRTFYAASIALPVALFAVHHSLGHRGDIEFFHRWYLAFRESAAFYRDGPGVNYPILGVLIVTGPARVFDAIAGHALSLEQYWWALKATLVLGEIFFIMVVERLLSELKTSRSREWALVLFALPSTWAASAWFGQIDTWGTVFLMSAALWVLRYRADGTTRSLCIALLSLVGALLTKQLTWFAIPFLAAMLLGALRERASPKQWAFALGAPIAVLVPDPFLTLPPGQHSHLWFIATQGSNHTELAVASGASLWSLVARGGTEAASLMWLGADSRIWGWTAFALAEITILYAAWRQQNPQAWILAAGLSELAMATLLTGVHERYFAHAIPLIVIARGLRGPQWIHVLGVVASILAGLFVLTTITPSMPALFGRPEPVALLSFAWGVSVLATWRVHP